jgi:hypothetical protein
VKNKNLPHLANNWLSAIGAVIAIVAFVFIILIIAFDFLTGSKNQYLGILAYMVIPPFVVFGLALIPIGMYLNWRRRKQTGEVAPQTWPRIDFNDKRHRRAAIIFFIGTAIFVTASAYGTYEAYHYSESVAFCGTLCHTVMQPEYTTYQNSPHARVKCTECHVGAGAGWYTKSKLSGAYQVYAVIANVYPRPIPTPVKNLRPARETCEQCHWPEKFFGSQQFQSDHYLYDENNNHWPINMLLRTGGGDPQMHTISGIHWHVSSGFEVEYIARDEKRQDIPWVKLINRQIGEEVVYQNSDDPLNEDEIGKAEIRTMDCMDCHNRPSHIYRSPDYAVDSYLQFDRISMAIPNIKKAAVELLAARYDSTADVPAQIAASLDETYQQEYPEFYDSSKALISNAAAMIAQIYSQNTFPKMHAKWSDYPNNIGHFYTVGCMRCHEGNHTSKSGSTITHTCTACHIILAQGNIEQSTSEMTTEGFEFKHPVDIGEAWREVGCYECHTGQQP